MFVLRFVNQPIKKLIQGTRQIAKGELRQSRPMSTRMMKWASWPCAINQMGEEIAKSQAELNKQRDEYQNLFEQVPCLITVQDKKYKLAEL